MSKKTTTIVLALVLIAAIAIGIYFATRPAAPAPTAAPTEVVTLAPTEAPTAEPVAAVPSTISVCLASEPDTLDPALNSAVDGATMLAHLFSGLATWERDEAGALVIAPDAAVALPEGVLNADGTVTYTYTLKDGLLWSDGKTVTAKDFEFAWKRAASAELGADYGYMFEIVKGYGTEELAVKALDDKNLEVTINNAVAYWNELLAFPTYFPVREDVVANEAWATDPATYVSNGAYTLTAWEHNSVITLTKSATYYDAARVTMGEIKAYLSDDANNMLANFQNGTWQLIDDIPTAEIANLKANYPNEFVIAGQIGTYYVVVNVDRTLLPEGSTLTGAEAEAANAEVRKALALLFDRNYIVTAISQGGQVPASSFVAMGLTDADGKTEFYKNTGFSKDFNGYFNVAEDAYEANVASAVETLKKYYTFDEATGMLTNFPTVEYIYNTSSGHKAIAEYLQSVLAGTGITMNLTNQEWATFLNTRKEGNYHIARNGWLGDYNDPISFLDMWTSGSGNNDVQFGKGSHAEIAMYNLDLTPFGLDVKVENGTWAQTYDVLIGAIKGSTDTEARFKMMHIAEDMLMATGCLIPIYYYTDLYMISQKVKGFYSNPLGYKYFMYTTIEP